MAEIKIPFENIRIQDAEKYIMPGDILIDLRDSKDYLKGHLPEAVNVPFDKLEDILKKIKINKKVFLYCETGSHSMLAARILSSKGYRVYNLYGGYERIKKTENR